MKPKKVSLVSGPDMNVYKINENPDLKTKCVGTIAMCTRDSIKAQTAISWLMSDTSFLAPNEYVRRFIVQGHILVAQRNECVAQMDGDWILFIDDDMAWQPSAIRDLVETQKKFDLDIVGGLCFQRGAQFQPTMYYRNPDGHGYSFIEKWPEDTAVEVDATGMAFCLIHKRVFERIIGGEFPPLEERKQLPSPPFFKWGTYGEDLMFCQDAKASGSRIYVDTSVKIGHIGETVITEKDFFEKIVYRTEEFIESRKEALDAINQPMMSKEEALERLGWK